MRSQRIDGVLYLSGIGAVAAAEAVAPICHRARLQQ
jgi:hypothetical protein